MPDALQMAYRDSAPNVICAYAYELAGAVNRFYHETRILAEPDKQKQAGYLASSALPGARWRSASICWASPPRTACEV